jgi:uncharacterized protein (TIGR00369 family)
MVSILDRLKDTSPFPHSHLLGIEFVELVGDEIVFRLPYSDMIIGNPETGVIHGGAITTLLDSCCGAAVAIKVADETINPTLDLRIDHMTAAEPNQSILGKAQVYRMTKSIAFVRGFACQENNGVILAHAVGTFMLMESPNKRYLGDLDAV